VDAGAPCHPARGIVGPWPSPTWWCTESYMAVTCDARELDETVLAKWMNWCRCTLAISPVVSRPRVPPLRWPHARQGVAFDTNFHASLAPWSPLACPWKHGCASIRRLAPWAPCLRGRIVASHDAGILKGRAVCASGGCSVWRRRPQPRHHHGAHPLRNSKLPAPSRSARCCIC
jgi:acetate kinase